MRITPLVSRSGRSRRKLPTVVGLGEPAGHASGFLLSPVSGAILTMTEASSLELTSSAGKMVSTTAPCVKTAFASGLPVALHLTMDPSCRVGFDDQLTLTQSNRDLAWFNPI